MNSIFFKVILIGILTVYCRLLLTNEECRLPKGCQLQMINSIVDTFGNSKIASKLHTGMRCDVYKGYKFKLDMSQIWNDTKRCKLNVDKDNPVIEIRWYKGDRSMLEKSMDITSMFILFCQLYPNGFILNMINIKRFDLDLIDFVNFKSQVNIDGVYCLSCRIVFYLDQNKILSCVEIELMERFFRGKIASIFQITKLTIDFDMNQLEYVLIRVPTNLMLVNSEFTDTICPLLFKNSLIRNFDIIGMIDSFYKKSILTIWNVYYDWLNSQIDYLYLKKAQNINLDSDLLNPSVFAKLKSLLIYGSVNRISEEAFTYLYYLNEISFQTVYFRKLMHTNGNEWIKAINSNRSVNMSDYNDVHNWVNYLRVIKIDCFEYMQEERMSQVFPDEDFCLYYDFPFQQLLLLVQNCYGETFDLVKRTDDFSCTFLWLSQYNELYSRLFKELNWSKDYARNLQRDANNYKENSNKCNFKSMIDRCSKSNMSIGDIWGRHDYLVLNKKLEIAVLVSTHLVSLFGLVTHIIVLITILYKKNSEFFKGFKQYSYLCANSVFSLLILLIQILAWTSECFYPFEVFCPEIRKLVFVQIYKMVFKECLVTAFRFMCNFTYVAFALNRISLIGKDHNKLVKFMSDVGIKKYLGVTLFISVGLSVVKYFKYEINYDQPETSYPISNELDLSSIFRTHISNDGFIIANSISDIFNYIVFVIVIFIVDVYMVVILRQTLNEKLKKSESLNKSEKILENMRKENEEAMNNVIRMIVLNTTLSLLFKLPVSFIPIVNVYAEFYYKSLRNQFVHPKFGEFYSFLLDSGFYDVIIHFSDFSYTFIISIQIFVYKHFDKKFRSGFERLIHGDKSKKKDANK